MEWPPPAAAGPRAEPSAPPSPPVNPSRLSEPETVKPAAPAIDAEPPAVAAADERERRWRGVIKNALVEGTMLQAFPVVIQKGWEAFHWKVLEKLKTAVSQYRIGLLIKPVRNPRSSVLIVVNLDTSRANVEFLLTKRRCNSCKKDNHTTQEYRKKGNFTPSMKAPRATTQMQGVWAASPQAASQLPDLPLQEAPEWMWKPQYTFNIKGPLGFGLSAFLMGQSSTALKGILVVPGLIDADYCGTVKIMIHVVIPPVSIPKGTRIAQLVPFRLCVPNPGEVQRGDGGFGSTGKPQVYFAMDTTRDKPEKIQAYDGLLLNLHDHHHLEHHR
ncbi:uncharacterized protein LOC126035466 isoform X2 [Accipiter gentilis]|uniref:uncharacterized protein LOC126035466 isoform X2 n=1 Tax=Astur gentilis TaxID=8957 RepID=UPI00210F9927|nr:uncharacterized protein LOC126035466 isoform X2 [Accipiter gentilis]